MSLLREYLHAIRHDAWVRNALVFQFINFANGATLALRDPGGISPFFAYWTIATIATLWLGFRAGALAVILSVGSVWFFHTRPRFSFALTAPEDIERVVYFALIAVTLSAAATLLTAMSSRLLRIRC